MMSRLTLLFLSLVLTFSVFEALARFLLPPLPTVTLRPNAPLETHPLSITLHTSVNTSPNELYVNTATGRRLRPNTHAVVENHETCGCRVEIQTNSLGFRGPEIGPKTKQRILFLGDSITFADYVPEEETWVNKIQHFATKDGYSVQSINGGIWAVGLANILAILNDTGLKTAPDLVVVGVYLNDVENSPGVTVHPLPYYLSWSRLLSGLSYRFRVTNAISDYGIVPDKVKESWRRDTRRMFPPPQGDPSNPKEHFHKAIDTLFFDWGSGFSEGAWEHMTPLLAEFKRLAEVHNFKLVFLLFPVADQVYQKELFDFPQQKMRSIAASLSVPFFDPLPALRKTYETSSEKLFFDWCHYTSYGNSLIAKEVYQFLVSQQLLQKDQP